MSPENFAYWLNGYFEVLEAGGDAADELTPEQVACIKDHLALVLTKRTPERGKKKKKAKQTVVAKDGITLRELADGTKTKATDILMKLLSMGMTGVHINTKLDASTVRALAREFGWNFVEEPTRDLRELVVTCDAREGDGKIDWVAPPVNPNQVRLDIEAEVKKSIEKPKTGVEFWVGRGFPTRDTRTYCAWTGGGPNQKVC